MELSKGVLGRAAGLLAAMGSPGFGGGEGWGQGTEQLWKSWTLLTESCDCGCYWHIPAIVRAS